MQLSPCHRATHRSFAVPAPTPQPSPASIESEVLTLGETAAFLRVPEEAVLALVSNDALPGQRIGGEWRFLKRAVVEWLRLGPHFFRKFGPFAPPWDIDHPAWERLLLALDDRVMAALRNGAPATPARGSSEAVLRHFGVFQDDGDLDAQLAATRAAREGAGR